MRNGLYPKTQKSDVGSFSSFKGILMNDCKSAHPHITPNGFSIPTKNIKCLGKSYGQKVKAFYKWTGNIETKWAFKKLGQSPLFHSAISIVISRWIMMAAEHTTFQKLTQDASRINHELEIVFGFFSMQ